MGHRIGNLAKLRNVPMLLGVVFCFAGASKLLGARMWMDGFLNWGYPAWMRFLLGWIELLVGAGMLLGRGRMYSTSIGTIILAGAVATHVRMEDYSMALIPASLLALLLLAAAKGWGGGPD